MLTYQKLKQTERRFLSITSLEVVEFDKLLPAFGQAWAAAIERRLAAQARSRQPGAGRKAKLATLEDKLLFILVYFKLYPLQEVQGELFGLSQGQANEWIQRLTPILQAALEQEQLLPERNPATLVELLAEYELPEFAIDGTECRRQRPLDPVEQRTYYSGKKKAHSLKHNLMVHLATRMVCYLSQSYPGKRHDKRICDEEGYAFPNWAELFQDTGFQGFCPPNVLVRQPKKKPRQAELTIEERFVNSVLSAVRIQVEHIICGVKRCRVLQDTFRNHLPAFADSVMSIACGLHNLRTRHRQPPEPFDLLAFALNPYSQ